MLHTHAYDPVISFLGMYPTEVSAYMHAYIPTEDVHQNMHYHVIKKSYKLENNM